MQQALIKWFKCNKRDLPWRDNPTPYQVWVSEIMLQQTQVAVVIPYFLRWVERFPTVEALAKADIEEVIKLWEGLGYYSRARNLHEGAREVHRSYGGQLPSDAKELAKIKGIGPYTLGAILSFAFKQKAAAVDGNVIRVLTRYFGIENDISQPATVKMIWKNAESILPDVEPWVFNEGLIELGATVCSKKPNCQRCPLQATCKGFQRGIAQDLPVKNKKVKSIDLFRDVAFIECGEDVLVRRAGKGEIMQDLYEFPFRGLLEGVSSREDTIKWARETLGLAVEFIAELPTVSHGFTKYRVKLFPSKFHARKKLLVEGYQWINKNKLTELPFNSGHKRVLVGQ